MEGLLIEKRDITSHVCVTALRQRLDELSNLVADISMNTTGGRPIVRQRHIENIIQLVPGQDHVSESFAVLGHSWKFCYNRFSDKADDDKWFELYLCCSGPIGKPAAVRWTVKLDQASTMRIKSISGKAGEDKEKIIEKDRIWCSRNLSDCSTQGTCWGSKLIEWDELISSKFMNPDGGVTLEVEFPADVKIITTSD